MGFLDRFKQIEIPEDKRRIDWSCLEERLALPEPLPLAELPIGVFLDGAASEPVRQNVAGDWILFYRQQHALVARGKTADAEAAWKSRHAPDLERQAKRFVDAIPTSTLRDHGDEALELLQLDARAADLFAGEKLLRAGGKLYNLVTLHDYARIFEKAIDPGFFRQLMALPRTVTPEEMLAQIAGSLPLIHKKARSPLRNKMECARACIGGAYFLPIYREPATALYDAQRRVLERELKVGILKRHA